MFKLLLLAFGGLMFVLCRGVVYLLNKGSQLYIINKIKKDPGKAEEYAYSLDIPIQKVDNISAAGFDMIKSKIKTSTDIGPYSILHTVLVSPERFLVFTKLAFTDFDVNVVGRAGDVSKKTYHNFLFQLDVSTNGLIMYSSLYHTATDKFQKEEFYKNLMKSQS